MQYVSIIYGKIKLQAVALMEICVGLQSCDIIWNE